LKRGSKEIYLFANWWPLASKQNLAGRGLDTADPQASNKNQTITSLRAKTWNGDLPNENRQRETFIGKAVA